MIESINTTNAQVWAEEFMNSLPTISNNIGKEVGIIVERAADGVENGPWLIDEGTMIGWFANAIEAGRDAGLRAAREQVSTPEEGDAT